MLNCSRNLSLKRSLGLHPATNPTLSEITPLRRARLLQLAQPHAQPRLGKSHEGTHIG